jgi:ketosteroid isomerase-like protein
MRAVVILGAATLLGVAACTPKPETPEQAQTRMDQEAATARTQIEAVAKNWERWEVAGQADSIAGVFTEAGYQLPPNAPPVMGRAAIQAYQAQGFGMGQWTVHISVDQVSANGPLAVSRGAYDLAMTPGPNAPAGMTAIADTGKWVGEWRQTGGVWQFATLIWNSNIPLPPPPAPTPSRRNR